MGKKIFYQENVKLKAIEMKLSNLYTYKQIMEQLGIKNKSQIKTWMRWSRNGEMHRLSQPIGKQYTYGKGPATVTELEQIKRENEHLKFQLEILKKYQEAERRWSPRR